MLRVDVAPNRSVSARTIIHHNISCVICFWNHSARNNKFQKGSGWPSDMFFLLKEFYSKLSKYKRHQNPMANCWSIIHGALHPTSFSSTTKVAGAEGRAFSLEALLIHNSQSHDGSFLRNIPTDPFNIPRYLQNINMKRFPRRVGPFSVEHFWLSYGLMRSHVNKHWDPIWNMSFECFLPPNTVHQKSLSTKSVPRSVYFDCMSFHKGQNSMPALCTDY